MFNVMKLVMFVFCAALAIACTDPEPLDPIGTWDNTYAWTSGTCQLTGSSPFPFAVLRASDTLFLIKDPDPSVTSASGRFICTETTCTLTLHETFAVVSNGTTVNGTVEATLMLDENNSINGGGFFSATPQGGTTCTHQFNATGVLR